MSIITLATLSYLAGKGQVIDLLASLKAHASEFGYAVAVVTTQNSTYRIEMGPSSTGCTTDSDSVGPKSFGVLRADVDPRWHGWLILETTTGKTIHTSRVQRITIDAA